MLSTSICGHFLMSAGLLHIKHCLQAHDFDNAQQWSAGRRLHAQAGGDGTCLNVACLEY